MDGDLPVDAASVLPGNVPPMPRIQRALLSVSDKAGLVPFARVLVGAGVELISTGGTAKALAGAGLPVIELGAYTGFPEMLDGRVKTLHPKVHAGLLFVRGNRDHEQAIAQHGMGPIDLVVVNLYPFEATVARQDVPLAEAIENIDIGGPSMLRSAAKNHESVTVVTDPSDYVEVGEQIARDGGTTLELRRRLAARVFARTAAYDAAIAAHLGGAFSKNARLPSQLVLASPRVQALRYGENPHQEAALYGRFGEFFEQLHGKELSYNNILDLTAATSLMAEFFADTDPPTLAILKHTNPCGVGQGADLRSAWEHALATDRQAPFGGIIAVNRPLDAACAEAVSGIFSEVIIAPAFSPESLEILKKKKNLRLVRARLPVDSAGKWDVRAVGWESYLVQEPDRLLMAEGNPRPVTGRAPSSLELDAMRFGWRVVKHVKSNAIVYVRADAAGHGRTLGIGAGQMSRVDASRIAVWKAGEAGLSLEGSVVCSDAYFPFPDGLVAAADAGAVAAIQPGGSVRDAEVIRAADERGMAMVFSGMRHFRH